MAVMVIINVLIESCVTHYANTKLAMGRCIIIVLWNAVTLKTA